MPPTSYVISIYSYILQMEQHAFDLMKLICWMLPIAIKVIYMLFKFKSLVAKQHPTIVNIHLILHAINQRQYV